MPSKAFIDLEKRLEDIDLGHVLAERGSGEREEENGTARQTHQDPHTKAGASGSSGAVSSTTAATSCKSTMLRRVSTG